MQFMHVGSESGIQTPFHSILLDSLVGPADIASYVVFLGIVELPASNLVEASAQTESAESQTPVPPHP